MVREIIRALRELCRPPRYKHKYLLIDPDGDRINTDTLADVHREHAARGELEIYERQ